MCKWAILVSPPFAAIPQASRTDKSSVGPEAQSDGVLQTAAGLRRTWVTVVKKVSQSRPCKHKHIHNKQVSINDNKMTEHKAVKKSQLSSSFMSDRNDWKHRHCYTLNSSMFKSPFLFSFALISFQLHRKLYNIVLDVTLTWLSCLSHYLSWNSHLSHSF